MKNKIKTAAWRGLFQATLWCACMYGLMGCSKTRYEAWQTVPEKAVAVYQASTWAQPVGGDTTLTWIIRGLGFKKEILQSIIVKDNNAYEPVYHLDCTAEQWDLLKTKLRASSYAVVPLSKTGLSIAVITQGQRKLYAQHLPDVLLISASEQAIADCAPIKKEQGLDIRSSNAKLFQYATLKSDSGNLYLNRFPFSALPLSDVGNQIEWLREAVLSAVLDNKQKDEKIDLIGFTTHFSNQQGFVPFVGQKPVPLSLWQYIPVETSFLVYYGFKDVERFVEKNISTDVPFWKTTLGGEIAWGMFGNSSTQHFLIIQAANPNRLYSVLTASGDTLGTHSNGRVFPIKTSKDLSWAKNLTPQIAQGYEKFLWKNNAFIFASSDSVLARLQTAFDNNALWGKSYDMIRFNRQNLQEANFTIYVDAAVLKVNPLLSSHLTNPHVNAAHTPKRICFQWSVLEDTYYTNINMEQGDASTPPMMVSVPEPPPTLSADKDTPQDIAPVSTEKQVADGVTVSPRTSVELPADVSTFTPVTEYPSRETAFIVQEKSAISWQRGQQKLWRYEVPEPIVSSIYTVDFFRNGKRQYFFATQRQFFGVDKLGRPVSGFPKDISLPDFQDMTLVEYRGGESYRWLISGVKNVLLADKYFKPVPGWKPKQYDQPIAGTPVHCVLRGTDYFFVAQRNGTVDLLKRNDAQAKGFPLKLNKQLTGEYYIDAKAALPAIYVLTAEKELIPIFYEGIVGQIVSFTGKPGTVRLLHTDEKAIVLQEQKNVFTLYNLKGELLFEIKNPFQSPVLCALLPKMSGFVLELHAPALHKSRLYDEGGKILITPDDIKTFAPVKSYRREEQNGDYRYYVLNSQGVAEEIKLKN